MLVNIQKRDSYPFFKQRIELAVEKLCWPGNSSCCGCRGRWSNDTTLQHVHCTWC